MKKKKIIIGLSGGVDSAVSAYILKKKYNVIAIFMQNWDNYLGDQNKDNCNQAEDWKDAQKVANHLKIKIYKVNFVEEYWKKVFLKFLKDLEKGVTPNPDISCNKNIKFKILANYIKKKFKCDFIATGHYGKIIKKKNIYYLGKAKDKNKDQTYFLCDIDKNSIRKITFPLSNIKKEKVREIANEIGLFNYKKKDSTGICFIGENNFNKFISNYFPKRKGNIIDIDSKEILGNHEGSFKFTIGQRKGLFLQGNRQAHYIIAKNNKDNIIYVAKGWKNKWLYSNWCIIKKINWLIEEKELEKILKNKIKAKFRHGQKETEVFLSKKGKNFKIEFKKKQRAITPGQYAVFYQKNICLGGGIILETEKNKKNCEPKI